MRRRRRTRARAGQRGESESGEAEQQGEDEAGKTRSERGHGGAGDRNAAYARSASMRSRLRRPYKSRDLTSAPVAVVSARVERSSGPTRHNAARSYRG